MVDDIAYSTFQGLRPHFDSLARVGYFKIVSKPLSPLKRLLHKVFRSIVYILVVGYNVQHIIRVIQVRHSTDQMVDTLFILLTILNTLGKQTAFNLRSRRIDRIIEVINGPTFAPRKAYHVKVLKEYAVSMSQLLRLYHGAVFTCGVLWTILPIVLKISGMDVEFTGSFPFDTKGSPGFQFAVAYMSILITAQAYGNVTMDCTIVALYAQAQTQIRILRYNLEQLLVKDDAVNINSMINTRNNEDTDRVNKAAENVQIQQRLVRCVQHYDQILWFAKEVESIFGEAMVIQFFVMAWVICMTVYKIVGLSILSVEFISMAVYLGCMLAQLFIYCYYGTQLKVESEYINQSIYCSGWLSSSPRFRHQLLIMMQRCSRPISPRTAYIIPMDLRTYISVLKTSYTLFTFLNCK